MKSIIEEASSLEKAITSAWNRTGKPKKFTITVFQEPEKNFFGMTTSPAKIGFLFEDKSPAKEAHKRPQNKPQKAGHANQPRQSSRSLQQQHPHKAQSSTTPQKPIQKRQLQPSAEQLNTEEQKSSNRFWSQEMISAVDAWLTDMLKVLGKQSITFTTKPNRYHLKIQLSHPLFSDAKKEKSTFRSFAHLIMQAQRSHFKKALKHHKIVLTSS